MTPILMHCGGGWGSAAVGRKDLRLWLIFGRSVMMFVCIFKWGERGHVCLRVGRGGDDVWLRLHLGRGGHGSASRLWGCWRTWWGCQWQSSWWENENGDNYDEDWGKKKGVNVKTWQVIEIRGKWQVKVTEKKKEKDCSPLPDLLLLLSSRTFVKEITLVEGGQF